MAHELLELQVADAPESWEDAGFTVADGRTRIGGVSVRFDGTGRGVTAWRIQGIDGDLDGIPALGDRFDPAPPVDHPNGSVLIDHVVVLSPDLDRTTRALGSHGVTVRRVREVDEAQYGFPARQVFFRLGEVILEVIGAAESDPFQSDRPSRIYGLAINVADIDAVAGLLGMRLGRVKQAVQPGRRIATLHHRDCGMTVATAFMSVGAGAV